MEQNIYSTKIIQKVMRESFNSQLAFLYMGKNSKYKLVSCLGKLDWNITKSYYINRCTVY